MLVQGYSFSPSAVSKPHMLKAREMLGSQDRFLLLVNDVCVVMLLYWDLGWTSVALMELLGSACPIDEMKSV